MKVRERFAGVLRILVGSADDYLVAALRTEATARGGLELVEAVAEAGLWGDLARRYDPDVMVVDEAFLLSGPGLGAGSGRGEVRPMLLVAQDLLGDRLPPYPVMGLLRRPPYRAGELRAAARLALVRFEELEELRAGLALYKRREEAPFAAY